MLRVMLEHRPRIDRFNNTAEENVEVAGGVVYPDYENIRSAHSNPRPKRIGRVCGEVKSWLIVSFR